MASTTPEREVTGETFVCDVCGRTFPSEAALRRHVREQGLAV